MHPFDGPEDLIRKLKRIKKSVSKTATDFSRYRYDLPAYARDVHAITFTGKQEEAAHGLITPPFRVYCPSANTQGKSLFGAVTTQWWFDTRNPSIALTTAPTEKQVLQILWGYIRSQRAKAGLGDFPSAVAPRLATGPEHWAEGYTAKSGTAFQGRHNECVLIIIDEAIGVDDQFFPAAESMLNGVEYAMLMLYNPTDGASSIRRMEDSGTGKVVRFNAMEHPNIIAERQGLPAPFPGASRLEWAENFIRINGEPVQDGSENPVFDIEVGWRILPDGTRTKGQWYKPNGEVEARVLGRWPTQSEHSVWSEAGWRHVSDPQFRFSPRNNNLQVGVDVALDGPDKSAFAVRQGGVLRYVQSFQGLKPIETHDKAKSLAWHYARELGINAKTVPIVVDDFGCGSKVMACNADGYRFIGIGGNEPASDPYLYPNRRSEIGFALADAARDKEVCFDVGQVIMDELKRQFLAMQYECRGTKRVLHEKKEQKKLLGKSPDEADAVMLAFANVRGATSGGERVTGHVR